MAALAEILDAGLHELAWSEWVWLLLDTKGRAIIAEFRDALSGARSRKTRQTGRVRSGRRHSSSRSGR